MSLIRIVLNDISDFKLFIEVYHIIDFQLSVFRGHNYIYYNWLYKKTIRAKEYATLFSYIKF